MQSIKSLLAKGLGKSHRCAGPSGAIEKSPWSHGLAEIEPVVLGAAWPIINSIRELRAPFRAGDFISCGGSFHGRQAEGVCDADYSRGGLVRHPAGVRRRGLARAAAAIGRG